MNESELGGFGDERLRQLGAALLGRHGAHAHHVHAHPGRRPQRGAVRFGRFLDNAAVSADEMLVHAGLACSRRSLGRLQLRKLRNVTTMALRGAIRPAM